MGLYKVKATPAKKQHDGILMIAVSNERESQYSKAADGSMETIQTVNFKVPGSKTDSGESVKVEGYTLFKAKDRKVAGTFITLNEEQVVALVQSIADAYTQITNKAIILENNVTETVTTSPVKPVAPQVTIEESEEEEEEPLF
jgi:hypothetical protein